MTNAKKPAGPEFRSIGGLMLTLTLAVLVSGLSTAPARADDRDHDNRGHERHAPRHYYRHEAPAYIYAPPPVYYAPPPRRPVFDLFIPLTIR